MIIADSMLGKLARYLRMIGYEVDYVENNRDDSYIVSISKDNLILTRDRQLHEKLKNSILLHSYTASEQLKELKGKLPVAEHGFMELCSICGQVLVRKENVNNVPEYVNKQAKELFYCENCDKYYWNGSHTDNFKKIMERAGFEIH